MMKVINEIAWSVYIDIYIHTHIDYALYQMICDSYDGWLEPGKGLNCFSAVRKTRGGANMLF